MVDGWLKAYSDMNSIGFMQGRLSSIVDGKIQAFPWTEWEEEFVHAADIDFSLMEWTIDFENLMNNPIMTNEGRQKILALSKNYNISIPSLTGDCFMQKPFWKAGPKEAPALLSILESVMKAAQLIGIKMILIPLVDNGKIDTPEQESRLIEACLNHQPFLAKHQMSIMFESDYAPSRLQKFIDLLPRKQFGINYDIGNSAALGFDPLEEFTSYGDRIINIHVKDRILNGTTVPLGHGNADFDLIFQLVNKIKYNNNFILQTARSPDNQHKEVLLKYKNMVTKWLKINES